MTEQNAPAGQERRQQNLYCQYFRSGCRCNRRTLGMGKLHGDERADRRAKDGRDVKPPRPGTTLNMVTGEANLLDGPQYDPFAPGCRTRRQGE